ncbi:AAA family ATPase [Herpetosiphon llansteffanensis]|uniref:AAA family ATPase n=1 Tax=Herpetosiphon llansteffanensis TaxID=2094568 RepID=UPI000D7BE2BA|nr:AAA family ATPase [Herpetosiphon llansteffanensis]
MLTRIEIDGFKTFHKLELDIAPFQVIIGTNGVGKSNFFDAIKLLSLLVEVDITTAFQSFCGEADELFTLLPSGERKNMIAFAVEVLVGPSVKSSWDNTKELQLDSRRLRYELTIELRKDQNNVDRLYINHEALYSIEPSKDSWVNTYIPAENINLFTQYARESKPFISTQKNNNNFMEIIAHSDSDAKYNPHKQGILADNIEKTILSSIDNSDFPHAFAVRKELCNWVSPQFNPEMLHYSSQISTKTSLNSAENHLLEVLARITAETPITMKDISRDMANLVSSIRRISVEKDPIANRYVIYATMNDDRRFSSMLLSNSTLRLLYLVTLKNDPKFQGLMLLEEPENGVHPSIMQHLLKILQDFSTGFHNPIHATFPLRQIIIITHSVSLIKYLIQSNKAYSSIFLAENATYIEEILAEDYIDEDDEYVEGSLYLSAFPCTKFHALNVRDKKSINRIIKYLEYGNASSTIDLLKSF